MLVKIYVTPKKSVLDPQGKAVAAGLHAMGYGSVGEVRVGKYLEIALDAPDAPAAMETAKAMCERLLANTVIEEYRIEIGDAAR
ncbi:MAG: phosphoribosylformylglycinamidine synthase subunit PurS [Acidobacteriota bacterium]